MIRHIVALDQQRGIARHGNQPWELPPDKKYFGEMTRQHGGVILMGRTTFEVIGHALVDRQNFVLTRNPNYVAPDATVVHDIDAFLSHYSDVWIIGGAQLYTATIDRAGELYVTEIQADFGCDTFYPDYRHSFQEIKASEELQDNNLTFRFKVYKPH